MVMRLWAQLQPWATSDDDDDNNDDDLLDRPVRGVWLL